MSTEIRVPTLGESVTEATIGRWFKKPGDAVKADEPLLELETDKVTLEVNAPATGALAEIVAKDGETVAPGALLGHIAEGAVTAAAVPAPAEAAPKAAAPAAPPPSPAAAKNAADRGVDVREVPGSGKRGQVLKGDVLAFAGASQILPPAAAPVVPAAARAPSPAEDAAREERVKMTKLRQTIARRLKEAQNAAAMLTTFNEVDMQALMSLRAQYKDLFEKKHGVKLGFMGFFVKACTHALKEIPAVNAEIDGDRHRLQELSTISAWRSAPKRAWWFRWCATPTSFRSPASKGRSPISASAPATASSRSRRCRAAPSPFPTAASMAR